MCSSPGRVLQDFHRVSPCGVMTRMPKPLGLNYFKDSDMVAILHHGLSSSLLWKLQQLQLLPEQGLKQLHVQLGRILANSKRTSTASKILEISLWSNSFNSLCWIQYQLPAGWFPAVQCEGGMVMNLEKGEGLKNCSSPWLVISFLVVFSMLNAGSSPEFILYLLQSLAQYLFFWWLNT